MLEADVLKNLLESPSEGIKVLTMNIEEPKGYGRIVRDENGNVTGIVEERDASKAQKAITEVNSGIIMTTRSVLMSCLEDMASENSQNEYYLTDVISIAYGKGFIPAGLLHRSRRIWRGRMIEFNWRNWRGGIE